MFSNFLAHIFLLVGKKRKKIDLNELGIKYTHDLLIKDNLGRVTSGMRSWKGLKERIVIKPTYISREFLNQTVTEFSLFSYFVTSLKIELRCSSKHVEGKRTSLLILEVKVDQMLHSLGF